MRTAWGRFRNHFATGLLVLGPLFITLVVIGYLVRLTDELVVDPLFRILPLEMDRTFKVVLAKLAIAVFVIIFVTLSGLAAERFIFKRLLVMGESFLERIPFFNKIYKAVKEVAVAFFGDKRGQFGRVVFIEYPRKGIHTVAFVMQEKPWEASRKIKDDLITVFVPSPPNPATGFCILVPKTEVVESEMSVEEGIRMVISYGAVIPAKR